MNRFPEMPERSIELPLGCKDLIDVDAIRNWTRVDHPHWPKRSLDQLAYMEGYLALLASTGIRRSNYAPPLLRLLWWLGIDVPPPHLGTFWINAMLMGVFFAIFWGAVMWLLVWSRQGLSVSLALVSSGTAGTMFGLGMAGYYAYGKRKHSLPSWKEFNPRP